MSKTRQLEIESLSYDGRGIARIDGKTSFIAGALPNEIVNAELVQAHKRFDEYMTNSITRKSEHRVTPFCAQYHACGGCQLQHLDYVAQIEHKTHHVLEQIKRSSGLKPTELLETLHGAPRQYRARARLSAWFNPQTQQYRIGFRAKQSKDIVNTDDCAVLHPVLNTLLPHLPELCNQLQLKKQLGHIELMVNENHVGNAQGSLISAEAGCRHADSPKRGAFASSAALGLRVLKPLSEQQIRILELFSQKHHCTVGVHEGNRVWKTLCSFNADVPLLYHTQQHALRFDWDNFTQANRALNPKMVQHAVDALQLEESDIVLDAFCGIGNFSFAIAEQAQHVIGIEGRAQTVQFAQHNAQHNQSTNTEFHHRNLMDEETLPRLKRFNFNKALIDPPRDGASALCQYLAKRKIKRIVYVSCSPSHLARDAKLLAEHRYRLDSIRVCDMFPNTSHTEVIACFVLK